MTPRTPGRAVVGMSASHRRYVSHAEAHYAGGLAAGAFSLGLFGDVATEICIAADGEEGLLACYVDVQFHAPIRAGDLVEATATVVAVGTRSRDLDFAARVIATTGGPDAPRGGPRLLAVPVLATTARGTVVVGTGI